jgi:glutamate---cysteine ligase / carboxylate-amine ligase
MTPVPAWAEWRACPSTRQLTIGVEEEFMLLDPESWTLAFRSEEVHAGLPADLRERVSLETHAAVMEVATGVHRTVSDALAELTGLRERLACALAAQGLRAGVAGTHPCALASDTLVPSHPRYREIDESMRVLARREPTLATHVHIGVTDPEDAVRLLNRLRVHLPLLLALSANSPFWRGGRTGFASTRTTLFDAFPRTGLPRSFSRYGDWVASVERLLRSGAIGDPSFLWWDARLQPRYGTVEVRIMDGQTTLEEVGALAALVQALASVELERRDDRGLPEASTIELIEENRFLAARDGMQARLIEPSEGRRLPATQLLGRIRAACVRHARRLRSERELASICRLVERNGAARQLAHADGHGDLRRVTARLADAYRPRIRPEQTITAAAS